MNGWMIFASTMLLLVGAINLIQGIVAIFTPDYFVAADGDVLFFNFTAWGVVLGVWGLLLIATGFAVANRQTWGRALAIALAAINAIAQLAFVAAYPWWSLAIIAIDLLVIYGLTVGWHSGAEDAYRSGRADAAGGMRVPQQESRGERGEHVR